MHYYTDIITHGRPFLISRRHWWKQVNNTVIEFHLSETSRSCQARTRTTHLTDRDANDCAISPPPPSVSHTSISLISLVYLTIPDTQNKIQHCRQPVI